MGGGCGRGALDVLVLVRPKGNALQPSFAFVRHRPGGRDASAPPVEPLPSGRFLARVPKSLHARLTSEAKKEGVSLITLVITLLAGGLVSRERVVASPAGERGKDIGR